MPELHEHRANEHSEERRNMKFFGKLFFSLVLSCAISAPNENRRTADYNVVGDVQY
jgi:hypothetical protein